MRRQNLALLIMVTVLTTGIALLPPPVFAQSGERGSTFVQGANQITDWFRYLSDSFDRIVELEANKQLIRRVENLLQDLYDLEKEREVAVRNWLEVFHADKRKVGCESLYPFSREENTTKGEYEAWRKCLNESEEMRDSYNKELETFRIQMNIVELEFKKFGLDLRSKGLKGKEVERIISVALGSYIGSDAIVISKEGPLRYDGAYGPLEFDKSVDRQIILRIALKESERCIAALHGAQEAALEFLQQLKREKA